MTRRFLNVCFIQGWLLVGLILFSPISHAKAYECHFNGPCGHVFTTEQIVTFSVEGNEEVGEIRVVNYDGLTVNTIPVRVRGKRLPVNLGKMKSGIYWLTEVDGRVLYSFAVIPSAVRSVKSEDSPFGVHYAYVDNEVDRAGPRLDLLKKAGVVWVRCSTYVTPKKDNPDTFDWSARDKIVDMVNERGMNMLSFFEQNNFPAEFFPLGKTKGQPGLWSTPRTMLAIQDFVTHFKGKLKYFEVWNEPSHPTEWIAFSKAFYETIKKANPQAVVVQSGLAGCAYPGQWGCEFLAQDMQKKALATGAEKFTDVFNYHFYPYQWKTEDFVSQILAIYKQYNVKKPVWVTENGISAAPKDMFQQKQQAEYLVRSATICFHLGVNKYFWFLGWDHPEFKYGLLEECLEPKAAYVAYAVLTKMLDGVKLDSSVELKNGKITGFVFTVPKGKVAVLWAKEGSTATVDPRTLLSDSPRVKVYDVMGRRMPMNDEGKITLQPQSPVYVTEQ